ncbi:hypothetical protein [Candidatus Burkholderia verschuerenii]|uniref:hypothetical protein n=1 Tax=Candidatus Burkholderia verschuerenii TaxID=242163 RepID=UPI0012ECF324|nr:hypothetical protein [Candidatus Burkholderia verschuerenii]
MLRIILAVPLGLLWMLFVFILPFIRMLIFVPLALAMIGGFVFAVYCCMHGAWRDAASAMAIAVVSCFLFAGFTALAENADPDFGRPDPVPPWWWYL